MRTRWRAGVSAGRGSAQGQPPRAGYVRGGRHDEKHHVDFLLCSAACSARAADALFAGGRLALPAGPGGCGRRCRVVQHGAPWPNHASRFAAGSGRRRPGDRGHEMDRRHRGPLILHRARYAEYRKPGDVKISSGSRRISTAGVAWVSARYRDPRGMAGKARGAFAGAAALGDARLGGRPFRRHKQRAGNTTRV